MGVVARLAAMVGERDNTKRPYECSQCGHRFHLQYYSCPKCDCYRVERAEWPLE